MGVSCKLYQKICKLYQKKSKAQPDSTAPVYLVLRIGGTERLIHTGKHLSVDHFDNATGRVRRGAEDAMRLNAYLQGKLSGLEKTIMDFEAQGRALTHEAIIAATESGGKGGFMEFAKSELLAAKRTTSAEYQRTTLSQLNKLDAYKPGLTFAAVTFEFLQRYEQHLAGLGNKPNTIRSGMVMIRKFLNLAIRKGLARNYPFRDYAMPGGAADKQYLTLKEVGPLHGMYDRQPGTELSGRLHGTLGHFLLGCYTGLRFGDVGRLNGGNLKDGQLRVRTEKTGKVVEIPLSNRALRLIGDFGDGRLFDRPLKQSNSRVNADLKEIMALAGIGKHITFHCSRHSFAINSLVLGIPLEVISNVLGAIPLPAKVRKVPRLIFLTKKPPLLSAGAVSVVVGGILRLQRLKALPHVRKNGITYAFFGSALPFPPVWNGFRLRFASGLQFADQAAVFRFLFRRQRTVVEHRVNIVQ